MQYFNFKNMLAYEIKEIEKTALLDHDQLLQAVLRMPYRPLSHGQDKLTTFFLPSMAIIRTNRNTFIRLRRAAVK